MAKYDIGTSITIGSGYDNVILSVCGKRYNLIDGATLSSRKTEDKKHQNKAYTLRDEVQFNVGDKFCIGERLIGQIIAVEKCPRRTRYIMDNGEVITVTKKP